MTDTNRHDRPRDRRARTQAVRDSQGQLALYAPDPEPVPPRANPGGRFLERPR